MRSDGVFELRGDHGGTADGLARIAGTDVLVSYGQVGESQAGLQESERAEQPQIIYSWL